LELVSLAVQTVGTRPFCIASLVRFGLVCGIVS